MEELTRVRNELGWSQQKLADESGVNKATINQIERGKRSPNIETLQKLADGMGREIGDFFPKAQAPLWSDNPPTERRDIYMPWLEFVNSHADRWEAKIAEGAFDRGAVDELLSTMDDLSPILIRLGLQEKQEQPSDYWFGYGPIIGEAIDRHVELLDPLIEASHKQFEESDLARLRRRREEMVSNQNQAANG